MQNKILFEQMAAGLDLRENGIDYLSIGFHITLYFGDGNAQQRREAAATIFAEYQEAIASPLRWQTHPQKHHWLPVDEALSPQRWVVENPDALALWYFCFHGGKTFDESSPVRIEGQGYPDPQRQLSFISCAFPVNHFADPAGKHPVDWLLRWAELLQAKQGSAGYALLHSFDRPRERGLARQAQGLARRFPGLEYNQPLSHCMYLQKKLKGVNWLTVVGDELLQALGPSDALASALAANTDVSLHPFAGGCIVQAGDFPQLGDTNQQQLPSAYVAVDQALAPIRMSDQHPPLLGFDEVSSREWFTRFEQKENLP